jgi:hypothetical protein
MPEGDAAHLAIGVLVALASVLCARTATDTVCPQ